VAHVNFQALVTNSIVAALIYGNFSCSKVSSRNLLVKQGLSPPHPWVNSVANIKQRYPQTTVTVDVVNLAIHPNLTRSRLSHLLLKLSKIAVGCSSHIFHARRSAT